MTFADESVKYTLVSVLSYLFLTLSLCFHFLTFFHTFKCFNDFRLLCQVVPLKNKDFVLLLSAKSFRPI